MPDSPRWWDARRAQNRKPASYRCPLCGNLLPALSEHMLLFPEGDHSRRRHAHTACVMDARRRGRLPTRDEYARATKRGAAEAAPKRGAAEAATKRGAAEAAPRSPPTPAGARLRRLLARLRG